MAVRLLILLFCLVLLTPPVTAHVGGDDGACPMCDHGSGAEAGQHACGGDCQGCQPWLSALPVMPAAPFVSGTSFRFIFPAYRDALAAPPLQPPKTRPTFA